jgi:hypothetical protein
MKRPIITKETKANGVALVTIWAQDTQTTLGSYCYSDEKLAAFRSGELELLQVTVKLEARGLVVASSTEKGIPSDADDLYKSRLIAQLKEEVEGQAITQARRYHEAAELLAVVYAPRRRQSKLVQAPA